VRFGILYNVDYYPEVHGSPGTYYGGLLDQVMLAEDLGYHSAWFGEHHYGGYSFGAPSVIATAAAMRTSRIRLGTGVSLAPLHNPVRLAEEYAMLDVLSGGRLEYGVGRGFLNLAYDVLGARLEESQERYREAIALITALWTASGPIDFNGKFTQLRGYTFSPAPTQRPLPPIYAAATNSPESFTWAGENGLHLCTAFFGRLDPAEVAVNVHRYRDALAAAGVADGEREVAVVIQMHCGEDAADTAKGVQYAVNYYQFLSRLFEQGGQSTEHGFLAAAKNGHVDPARVLIGQPSELTAALLHIDEQFSPYLLLMEVAQGGTPFTQTARSLELFAKQVAPEFSR
jgi:alkanesulfonate monooxygenase SsuD/methylene tetrahydromethanopterin reductase-like flavin-dependent oxidoreductase (luciferase family)